MFQDAEREKLFAKIALIGASGSGKTVGALKLAYGLTGDWKKIAVADTENKRSLAYVGTQHTGLQIGSFKHAPMYAPYTTESFSKAIDEAIKIGAEVLIFDSFSHEWEGLGGVTHAAEEAGGEFWNWKGPKINHRRLVDKIQQSALHVIVTIRTKQEYAVITGGGKNGKNAIEKLGMKPVQSNDLDYEFLIAFHADEDHEVVAKKDNTGLFQGEAFRLEAGHGEKLRNWLVEGKEVKSVAQEAKEKEERKAFILQEIANASNANDKAKAYFAQLEVKYKRPVTEFPLDTLEQIYAKMNAKKEQPKQEAPKQEQPEGETLTKYTNEIINIIDDHPELALGKLRDEFVQKHNVKDMYSLDDKSRETLLQLLNFKVKKGKSA